MIEYVDVYLKKQSAEYARIILNVSDAVYGIRSLNLLSSYRDRRIQNTVKKFQIKRFAKRIMPECRCATRNFSGQEEDFVELGHFYKHFIKNAIRAFLSRIRKLFSLVVRLWVWLNMHQYTWICLNILGNGWINCSDYARALNLYVHLTCSAGFGDASSSK